MHFALGNRSFSCVFTKRKFVISIVKNSGRLQETGHQSYVREHWIKQAYFWTSNRGANFHSFRVWDFLRATFQLWERNYTRIGQKLWVDKFLWVFIVWFVLFCEVGR